MTNEEYIIRQLDRIVESLELLVLLEQRKEARNKGIPVDVFGNPEESNIPAPALSNEP